MARQFSHPYRFSKVQIQFIRRIQFIRKLFFPMIFMGLMILIGMLLAGCSGKSLKSTQATPTPIPTPVIQPKPTFQVQRGEMVNELQFSGRLAPTIKQDLSFAAGGKVAKVTVQRGDSVYAGQLLAELETNQNGFDLRRAQINLEIGKLNLELAELQTPQSSEIYSVTVAIREQELALAQLNLDELNSVYTDTRITSPISGTVFTLSIAEGDVVEAKQTEIVIANLDNLVINADLTPNQMSALTVGMKVTVDPVSRTVPQTQGTIQSLPYPYGTSGTNQSTDTQHSGSTVQITLDKSPKELGYKVGDMVNMTIVLEQKLDALWLPTQAVRQYEGRYFVIVQDGDSQRRVDIKTGIIEADRIEVVDGLTDGQVVIGP